jgi:hypothetical protein
MRAVLCPRNEGHNDERARRVPDTKRVFEWHESINAGRKSRKVLAGTWDPNPYHSGPSTYTINFVTERKV